MMRLRSTLLCALAGTSVLLASACAVGPPAPEAHSFSQRQAAIVNGSLESGWQGVGALTYTLPGYGYQGEFCTATLITPQWVLTAGHCVSENDGFTPYPETTYLGAVPLERRSSRGHFTSRRCLLLLGPTRVGGCPPA